MIDEERDGVEGEGADERDGEAPIESLPPALAVQLLGAAAPASVARVADTVRLDATLDDVHRHVVPRYAPSHAAREQNHTCAENSHDCGIFGRSVCVYCYY